MQIGIRIVFEQIVIEIVDLEVGELERPRRWVGWCRVFEEINEKSVFYCQLCSDWSVEQGETDRTIELNGQPDNLHWKEPNDVWQIRQTVEINAQYKQQFESRWNYNEQLEIY